MRRKKPEPELTLQQYESAVEEFSQQRASVCDLYMDARRRSDIAQCHRLYDLWREIVAEQRDWMITHPAPVSV